MARLGVVVGVALLASQLFAASPWQGGVALGVVLIVCGALAMADRAERQTTPRS